MKTPSDPPVITRLTSTTALSEFTIAITTQTHKQQDVYAKLAEYLPNLIPADRSSVTLVDDTGEKLEIFSLHGSEGALSIGKYLPIDNSYAGSSVLNKQPLIAHMIPNDSMVDGQLLEAQGLKTTLNMPLTFSDRVIGTVNVGSFSHGAYNEDSIEVMTLVTTLVSHYLERLHLLQQAQKNAHRYRIYSQQLTALNQLAEKLGAATSKKEIFNLVITSAAQILPSQQLSYITPLETPQLFTAFSALKNQKACLPRTFPIANTSLEMVMETSKPQFFDVLNAKYQDHLYLQQAGMKSSWCAPIQVKGETRGIIHAASDSHLMDGAQQLNILSALSNIIGVTMSRVQTQKQLEYQACYDSLTGLPNRSQFRRTLEKIVHTKKSTPFTLLFIDLDRFKVINDTLGHDIGDQLLYLVTQRISHQLRDKDIISRHGGDEFVVLLPDSQSADMAITISDRIINELKSPFSIDSHTIFIGASIGISHYPLHSSDSSELLKYADIAMYQAKKSGKNKFHFYSSHLLEEIHHKQKIDHWLRTAIENQELFLHFQPLIEEGAVTGIEALTRWRHPELGDVRPETFINIAEEGPLIEEITQWVIDNSLSTIKELRKTYPNLFIAINISARDCLNPQRLLQYISEKLSFYKLPGTALELEITEGVYLQNLHAANQLFSALQAMDVHISIDDFGTGFSSLTYLLNLPLDTIKIDQSFTLDIHSNKRKQGIVKSILTIAQNLSMSCIAEGIETEEQKSCLTQLGCTRFQGFLFSHPLNKAGLIQFLAKNKNIVRN